MTYLLVHFGPGRFLQTFAIFAILVVVVRFQHNCFDLLEENGGIIVGCVTVFKGLQ